MFVRAIKTGWQRLGDEDRPIETILCGASEIPNTDTRIVGSFCSLDRTTPFEELTEKIEELEEIQELESKNEDEADSW
jgi:hypothetical protein